MSKAQKFIEEYFLPRLTAYRDKQRERLDGLTGEAEVEAIAISGTCTALIEVLEEYRAFWDDRIEQGSNAAN